MSKKSRITCRKCGQALSFPLEPVSATFRPEFIDHQNIIPRGQYWQADQIEIEALKGHLLIHLEDRLNLRDHPDPRRSAGCCGKDGCDGPNLVCRCGSDVATECSDCWTSYYIHFEPLKVELVMA